MSFKIIVLAKQVPDTRNVGKDAMKEDGTVNRGALPAIFNPDDLNALEMALEARSLIHGAELSIITMGPPRAASIIRESMYRGANNGYLLTDSKFAGSDTLATSYALTKAVEACNPSLVFCGVQAIDGDTAQVGPQIAEKLKFPQITYAEKLVSINAQKIRIKRRLERGIEIVETSLPALITVHSSANPCRSRHAKLLMKYKHARTMTELREEKRDYTEMYNKRPDLLIQEWNVETIHADAACLGLNGSPTKVKKIDSVVLTQKDSKIFSNSDTDVEQLVMDLLESRVIG
ncbi:MAG: electron transfer flavoprotein subunit beta/FixA family protein [Bacteroidales bacterium]|jgi:electron transfer flavoprotein beta subunit|nr:electron transfer flavoprotein subunit beta/FixA family protein [Bacteroidales bacterium]